MIIFMVTATLRIKGMRLLYLAPPLSTYVVSGEISCPQRTPKQGDVILGKLSAGVC